MAPFATPEGLNVNGVFWLFVGAGRVGPRCCCCATRNAGPNCLWGSCCRWPSTAPTWWRRDTVCRRAVPASSLRSISSTSPQASWPWKKCSRCPTLTNQLVEDSRLLWVSFCGGFSVETFCLQCAGPLCVISPPTCQVLFVCAKLMTNVWIKCFSFVTYDFADFIKLTTVVILGKYCVFSFVM